MPSGFPTRSDKNQAVQPQGIARGLQFQIKEIEGLYYLSSENKGADQQLLMSAFVFAYAKSSFSHDTANVPFFFFFLKKAAQQKMMDVD